MQLAVHDWGAAVDPAQRKELFELFSRGRSERRSEGWGVGLSVVTAMARAHGGSQIRSNSANRPCLLIGLPRVLS